MKIVAYISGVLVGAATQFAGEQRDPSGYATVAFGQWSRR